MTEKPAKNREGVGLRAERFDVKKGEKEDCGHGELNGGLGALFWLYFCGCEKGHKLGS